jgi:hypothetical protein
MQMQTKLQEYTKEKLGTKWGGRKTKTRCSKWVDTRIVNTICTEQQFATCNPQKAHN